MSRTATILVAAAALALSACAPAAKAPQAPVPAPCADSLYAALKRQHPDSLSERAWQRLQMLDLDCAESRAPAAPAPDTHMMGMGSGGGWRLLGVTTIAVMALMMAIVR